MAEALRGKGLMGIISKMGELDESGINKKADGGNAKPAGGISPFVAPSAVQPSAPRTSMDRLHSIMPELYKIEKDPNAIFSIPADKLKTLCDLKLIDVSLNEKGRKTAESYRLLESMAGEIKAAPEPKPLRNFYDTPILGDKGGEKHTLAENVSAIPDTTGIRNDNVIIAKGGGSEIKKPKSMYLIETPRQAAKPAEKQTEGAKAEAKPERKPLIPPP